MKVLCCVMMVIGSVLLASCGQEGALYLPASDKKPIVQKKVTRGLLRAASTAS